MCHNNIKISTDLTHGWWSITSTTSIDQFLRTLCVRGFREKSLYKALQKNKEIIAGSVNPDSLKDCEKMFKELLVAHQNNKLLPSVTSSNSSSSSSSSSDSDDDSSGEGVKSEDSEEEEAEESSNKMDTLTERDERVKSKNATDTDEAMDTSSGDKKPKEDVATSSSSTSSSSTSSEDDKSSAVASSNERTKDQANNGPGDSTVAVGTPRGCEVPTSGVYDPTYPSMTLHVAVKVMEYLEAMQQRLITASLAVEVGVVTYNV